MCRLKSAPTTDAILVTVHDSILEASILTVSILVVLVIVPIILAKVTSAVLQVRLVLFSQFNRHCTQFTNFLLCLGNTAVYTPLIVVIAAVINYIYMVPN